VKTCESFLKSGTELQKNGKTPIQQGTLLYTIDPDQCKWQAGPKTAPKTIPRFF
jgi:hypothetical protein